MVFDPELQVIAPEATGDHHKSPNLVDITVLKRAGGFNSVTNRNAKTNPTYHLKPDDPST